MSKDTVFGRYEKCPKCGKFKGLYYQIQYPTFRTIGLNGRNFIFNDERRTTKIMMYDMVNTYHIDICNKFQEAKCICQLCGWKSETIFP